MAEEGQVKGDQMENRLKGLVERWAKGRVSLKQIVGLTETELYTIASQGYLLFLQGKTEEARLIFEGLVALEPRNAYYYRALGSVYWRLGEPQKAIKQFTYALRVSPHDVASYVNRAEVYVATQAFQEARSDLEQALRRAKPAEHALTAKARAIMQMIVK